MDVPPEVILAEIVVVIGAVVDEIIECIQAKVPGFAELAAQWSGIHITTQSPDGIYERQFGQFIPGSAQIPYFMVVRAAAEVDGWISDEQGVIRERGGVTGEGKESRG